MNGLGFLIWKLASMPAVSEVIRLLNGVGAKWVSIKVADGVYTYNQKGGDPILKAFIHALQEAGFAVSGWHYVYAEASPGAQGDRIMERREKLDLKEILVDIEDPGFRGLSALEANRWASVYMDKQHAGTVYGHCSHRFPTYHPYIPHRKMLKHERMDAITPMVYWEQMHNPVEQLQRSLDEYRQISDKPFIPIGPTYSRGRQSSADYWEPTVEDLIDFEEECTRLKLPGRGYYSLDYIIQHKRTDWLAAISDWETPDPPAPPPAPVEWEIANCTWLNGRSTPSVVDGNQIVQVRAGQKVTNLHKESGPWRYCGLGPISAWMHGDYLEPA